MDKEPILHNPNHTTGKWDAYNQVTNRWEPTDRSYNQAGTAVNPTTFVKYDIYGNRIGGRKSRRNIRRRGYSKKHKRVHHTRRKHTRRHRHRR